MSLFTANVVDGGSVMSSPSTPEAIVHRPAERGVSRTGRPDTALFALSRAWMVVGIGTFVAALVLTYEFSLDGPRSLLYTVLPFIVLATMLAGLASPFARRDSLLQIVLVALTLCGWAILMFHDDRWSVLSFALYGLCFASGRTTGIALAAAVSIIWFAAWLGDDDPGWRLVIPFVVYATGVVMAQTLHEVDEVNANQASLITELRTTQQELAMTERERGILEERARFAGEIHDTLAQGFTSIVLVSRASRKSQEWEQGLATIEATAQTNLNAARRLVAALSPAELDVASLPQALRRQLDASLPADVERQFEVAGESHQLSKDTEALVLRSAQEALLNVSRHAQAKSVDMTLSYLGDVVALDVRDDGVGFAQSGRVDRGDLTGGQGLQALRHRIERAGGQFSVEDRMHGGTVLSVQMPVAQT